MLINVNTLLDGTGRILNFGSTKGLGLYAEKHGKDKYKLVFYIRERDTSLKKKEKVYINGVKSDSFHSIAIIYKYLTKTTSIYLNGVLKKKKTKRKPFEVASNFPIMMGGEGFRGRIACLHMYSIAQDADTVKEFMKCPLGKLHIILILDFPFLAFYLYIVY